MKRLTVGMYALHYVLYLCTLNKSRMTRAASLTRKILIYRRGEVGRVEEEIVIEPVIGVQDEAVVERVCRFI